MSEPMTVRVEVWPVAADELGIWLVSGEDAWRSALPVMADSEPHAEVELALAERGAAGKVALLHSTSWRVDDTSVMVTYVAVIECGGLVREEWPSALPLSTELPAAVGTPPTNSPIDAPAPRYVDVLMHGIRHLRFLLDTDGTARAAMNEQWRRHLSPLEPALAGLYKQEHASA